MADDTIIDDTIILRTW